MEELNTIPDVVPLSTFRTKDNQETATDLAIDLLNGMFQVDQNKRLTAS